MIFVDVDGPLIPFKARPVTRERSLGGAVVQPLDGTGKVGGLTAALAPRARRLLVDQVRRYAAGEPLANVVVGP
ncbi:hypothetical protein [Micromonospora sp. NPDC002717]|uniref:hypothetical protein n=1 Tax=Micromonospora sp. NPDC002717 TaxID=3154424 RepID=UPI0033260795